MCQNAFKKALHKTAEAFGYDLVKRPHHASSDEFLSNSESFETSAKTFVLGVGAQKSGTTWLHHYLETSHNAHLGFMKEYHIWDAKNYDQAKSYMVQDQDVPSVKTTELLRYLMLNQDGFYEQYFNAVHNDGWSVTGDITPSYSMLSAAILTDIKTRLEDVGFDVKVVFLMRDPVERCRSAARSYRRIGHTELNESQFLEQNFKTELFQVRTRYEVTVQNLERVFSTDNIFYGIYEEFFEDKSLQDLSRFIGVEYRKEVAGSKINRTDPDDVLSQDIRKEICAFYRETYEFCSRRFPQTKKLWAFQE